MIKEMETNELRIGNILIQGKVKSLYYDGAVGLDDGNFYPVDSLSPIPLNANWLNDLGFTKDSPVRWTKGELTHTSFPEMTLYINQFTPTLFTDDKYGKILKYVHELQNFYFIMRGRELNSNPPI